MKILPKIGVLFSVWAGTAFACMGPTNVQGVVLNNDEPVHFDVIESLGENGEAYIKEVDGDLITYRLRSEHYDEAMVYISNRGVGYMSTLPTNTFGIKVNSELYNRIQEYGISLNSFSFGATLQNELRRFNELGILELSDDQIDEIIRSFADNQGSGGFQYWTKQQEVLGYNSWYDTNGSSNGVDSSGWEDIPTGVKSGGSSDAGDGCGGTILFDVPSKQPSNPTGITDLTSAVNSTSNIVTSISNNAITISLDGSVHSMGQFDLYSASGRRLFSQSVAINSSSISLPMSNIQARGVYYLVANIDGVVSRHSLVK